MWFIVCIWILKLCMLQLEDWCVLCQVVQLLVGLMKQILKLVLWLSVGMLLCRWLLIFSFCICDLCRLIDIYMWLMFISVNIGYLVGISLLMLVMCLLILLVIGVWLLILLCVVLILVIVFWVWCIWFCVVCLFCLCVLVSVWLYWVCVVLVSLCELCDWVSVLFCF